MGASSSGGGSSGGGNNRRKKTKTSKNLGTNRIYSTSREIGLMNQYKPENKTKTVTGINRQTGQTYSYETTVNQRAIDTKKMKNEAFRQQGAYSTRRGLDKIPDLGVTTAVIKGLSPTLEKNAIRNRDFFTNYVLNDPRGKKNFGYNKDEFQNLSVEKQDQIYNRYMRERMSNRTDGYGTILASEADNKTKVIIPKTSNVSPDDPPDTTDEQESSREKYDARKTKRRGRRRTILTSQTGAGGNVVLGKPSLLGM
tara:strand:- start:57 stop:818 length:762 start_codon:yes stop_codon:yes gene_type:complete